MTTAEAALPRTGRARWAPAIAIVAAVIAFAMHPASAQPRQIATEQPVKVDVEARPIDAFDLRQPELRQFGALRFRGGLELTSTNKKFGGLSALRILADGERFVSVTDKGYWFTGRIAYERDRPAGIADAELAPVLGPDGRPLSARGWYDTESIAQDGDTLYVGIERVNRIIRFNFGKSGVLARGQPIAVPLGVSKLPYNKGLEALAFVPKGRPLAGTLIAISERGLDAAGAIKGFLIGGPTPGEFAIKRSDDFDISDCALLPSGDLVLLERRFAWTTGVAIRLRRIPLTAVVPGALVDGPVLMTADMGYQVDNMEGLSAHATPHGETVLTMISDDNFSPLQRTILLQFTLSPE
jgi:hypothetical protein